MLKIHFFFLKNLLKAAVIRATKWCVGGGVVSLKRMDLVVKQSCYQAEKNRASLENWFP